MAITAVSEEDLEDLKGVRPFLRFAAATLICAGKPMTVSQATEVADELLDQLFEDLQEMVEAERNDVESED